MATNTQQIIGTPFNPEQQITAQNEVNVSTPGYTPGPTAVDMTGTTPTLGAPTQTPQQLQQAVTDSGQQPAVANPQQIAEKYKAALPQIQATGTPPASAGQASATVAQYAPPTPPPPTPTAMDVFTQTNAPYQEAYNAIQQDYQDFFSSEKQRGSSLDEYKKLQQQFNLPKLNEEAINIKNVIEGTEDDIRNELTKGNGVATESQVLAMAGARNKSLIKNYNKLVDTINNANSQVNTMIGLSQQDRQMAQQDLQLKLQFERQKSEIIDKMQTNAKDAYNKVIEKAGYVGLYQATAGNPYYISLVEKTLGLAPGGLEQLANYQEPLSEKDSLDIQGKRLQNAKLSQDLSKPNTEIRQLDNGNTVLIDKDTGDIIRNLGGAKPTTPPTPTGIDQTITPIINPTTGKIDPLSQFRTIINNNPQAKSDDKLKLTGAVISGLQSFANNNTTGSIEGLGLGSFIPPKLLNQKGQSNRTILEGLKGTVESWMTGASVSNEQQKRINQQLIPKITDSDGEVRRKVNALMNYMLTYASGSLATQGVDWAPETVDLFAPVVVTDPTGDEWETI